MYYGAKRTTFGDPKPEKTLPKAKKPINKVSEKRKGGTGELALFMQLWEVRPHTCFCCDDKLGEFSVSYFSHILTKGAYPSLRLDPDNIAICCNDCHYLWDNGSTDLPIFKRKLQLKEKLKREYYNKEEEI